MGYGRERELARVLVWVQASELVSARGLALVSELASELVSVRALVPASTQGMAPAFLPEGRPDTPDRSEQYHNCKSPS